MFYKLVQIILRVYLPFFFKRIEVRGLNNIPKDKPVLLAVNHQNAFLDAMLVGYKMNKPVYFLTRSDVFKGKWVLKIFNALNLVPIFRKKDGDKDFKFKNNETFDYCIEQLKKKKPILIFPEGVSEPVHHLFKLKKGVARLALKAESEFNFDLRLHLVPVAVNYENHFLAGKKAFVSFLDPIIVSEYKNIFRESESRAMKEILDRLEENMRENTIHIFGDYMKFKRKYWRGIIRQSRNDKEMIAAIKSIPKDESGFSLKGFNWKKEKYKYEKKKDWGALIFYMLICLPGFLLFLPTIIITKLITFKLKDESFYLSIKCVGWLLFGIIQTIFLSIILWGILDVELFSISLVLNFLLAGVLLRNFNKIH